MEIKALRQHGWKVTSLAEEFDLARGTIYAELASPGPWQYRPRAHPMALNQAQLIHVERRLVVCPDLRGTDLHGELRRDYGYEGSYPVFQRLLALTAGIWWNWQIGASNKRSLVAYKR